MLVTFSLRERDVRRDLRVALMIALGGAALCGLPSAVERPAPGVPVAPRRAGGDTTLRLVLNVPAFRLDALEDGRPVLSVRVAVGTRAHRTPLGRFAVSSITWNPWWYPRPHRGRQRTRSLRHARRTRWAG